MTITTPPWVAEQEELPLVRKQHEIVRRLLEQWDAFQNICTVLKVANGQYHIHVESFVFELDGWIVNDKARMIPYVLDFIVDNTPVAFHYLKPSKLPEGVMIDFEWKEKIREEKTRIVLPVARIRASRWYTLVRPNHLYYSWNWPEMWVSEAIIALNIVGNVITDQNRYYPLDCAGELLANIASWDPTNPCTLRTFDITEIERTTVDVIQETINWVEWIKNPLS